MELAELLMRSGAEVDRDLEELWRRIVFNIAVSNCDDHLRNHGSLLSAHGWRLSPAYDLNPDPDGLALTLNITENDNALDFSLALSIAKYFGLNSAKAEKILHEIRAAVRGWREVAERYEIPVSEQERMRRAFRS